MNSSLYSAYRVKDLSDRTIDQLIGMSQMAVADGQVTTEEAEVLRQFLQRASLHPTQVTTTLLSRLNEFFEDGVLQDDEAAELFELLQALAGGDVEAGELAKPSTLPLCSPIPDIHIRDKKFCFTGTFAFGSRGVCQEAVFRYGGLCTRSSVTYDTDFLVIGSYVSDSWKHEAFGRKIQKAMDYRAQEGVPKIVGEDAWLRSLRMLGCEEAHQTKLPSEAIAL